MNGRKSIINIESEINGEILCGETFDVNKYYKDLLSNLNFNFNSKEERTQDVSKLIAISNDEYKKTSEEFIEILLKNYQIFMNIGKYVEKVDKNITNLMNSQKPYSGLLQDLRKDVEEFTIDYTKYLKEIEKEEQRAKEKKTKEHKDRIYFDEFDNFENVFESGFDLDEFLNPKNGTKRWLEEQPEKLRVLIDEKKFTDCVKLMKEIRISQLDIIDYETKIELDNVYNYLIEKLTVSISRCNSSKDVQFYLEQMKALGCFGIAIDTFLNWLSKKMKTKLNKNMIKEDKEYIREEISRKIMYEGSSKVLNEYSTENLKYSKFPIDKKIIKIIDDYFKILEKFTKIIEDYFKIKENPAYSSYFVTWLKAEIQIMTKTIEILFSKIRNIDELKNVIRHLNGLISEFDRKGISCKYIFDLYFINNIKISLEAIINFCMKSEKEGVGFDLKEYEIKHKDKIMKLNCVSELGNSLSSVSKIISDFIVEFINNKNKFIGIIFLEEYFFENILCKEFINFVKNKISKNMTKNYEVKTFYDYQDSIAQSNQILINYGISILSIEDLFNFFLSEMHNDKCISSISIESMTNLKIQINESKKNYFANLFKIKIESHFFKFFDTNKATLSRDMSEDFKEPDRAFIVLFNVIKNLAKNIRVKVEDPKILKYFVLDNQVINFLKIVDSLRDLDKLYDTEFNFSKLGIFGLEILIHGIIFVYCSINKILGFDDEGKYKILVDEYIDDLIVEFGVIRKINTDRFFRNKQIYYENVIKYISENRIELLKGY